MNVRIVVNFLSRSGDSLISGSFLDYRISLDRLSSLVLRLRSLEVDSFGVVDDSFLINRLCVNFFSRSLENVVNDLLRELSGSGNNRKIVNLRFSSVNLQLNVFGQNGRLVILLSDCCFTRNVNWNRSGGSLIIYDWFKIFCFSINRS